MYNVLIIIRSVLNENKSHWKNVYISNRNIIYHNKIEVFEETHVDKTNEGKGCAICLYWYLLDKSFHFQSYICNGCYFRHTDVDYRCFIYRISEREAASLLKNVDLSEKYRTL